MASTPSGASLAFRNPEGVHVSESDATPPTLPSQPATGANPLRDDDSADQERPEDRYRYVHTTNVPELLASIGASILVTTYQAGKLLAFSSVNGRLKLLMRSFPHPMGMAVDRHRMALLCQNQIWFLANRTDLVDQQSGQRLPYDSLYVPRRSHVTGDIAGHEIAWGAGDGSLNDELWVVNTRFSCLCTLDEEHSFVPRWKPSFVSEIAPGDRCHLNGLCVVNGKPKYVTCLAETNEPQGWRDRKVDGGLIIDLDTNEIITRGMPMPHSPRLYNGKLYVLSSGAGELHEVDLATGQRTTIIQLPGFLRGLSFHGPLAFIGSSQARENRTFGGLPLEERREELECGVFIVDLRSGKLAGFIRFEAGCRELFDVQALPNTFHAGVIGFSKETINGVFILPRESMRDGQMPVG